MSSDFSISEFRRRRAGDNPPPPETGQLPLEMPAPNQDGPQEFVPQTVSAPIPEAVQLNPYAPQTMPMAEHAQPAVNPIVVQPPVHSQGAVPLPMPITAPEKAKKESKSLVAGLLAKFKKDSVDKTKTTAHVGPVEYSAPQDIHSEAPQTTPFQQAPLRAAIPAKQPAKDPASAIKVKSGLPTWAAFLLGLMTGVIMTVAGLALTAKTVDNSLEARFSEKAKVVQSAETAIEEDVVETPESPSPL